MTDSATSGLTTTGASDSDSTTGGTGEQKYDVGDGYLDLPSQGSCKVNPDGDGVGSCEDVAPPDSFDADVQWAVTFEEDVFSTVTPLVANLTDDDGNGVIDLCDTPDIVIKAFPKFESVASSHMYILDGATGSIHYKFDRLVKRFAGPAIADLDADGVPEILAITFDERLAAFRPDGTVKWESEEFEDTHHGSAIAVANVDNEGLPEILYGGRLFSSEGELLLDLGNIVMVASAPALADLDGDGDQELVFGQAAYHHDGSLYYLNSEMPNGQVAIADFDGDGDPEVLFPNYGGLAMLENDGTPIYQGLTPTGDPVEGINWPRPPTVHDFDADGEPEFASSSAAHYSAYEADATILWTTDVVDDSGLAGGTAFDFLGDGTPEAMYADEHNLFVYDELGDVLMQVPRQSRTLREYPVVADVDNDGSAEIVVVSNETTTSQSGAPTVQVIRDKQDRWIQARRIWNQHTYHVTNVREDATIPLVEPPSWQHLNTYRVNAQIAKGGGVCKPKPQG